MEQIHAWNYINIFIEIKNSFYDEKSLIFWDNEQPQ